MIGTPIPDFALQDDRGSRITREDLAGHWTVLYAYPKDATPGCTREACDFRDSWGRIEAAGARVFGLSRDSVKSHRNFIANKGLPFRLISDPEAVLLRALGAFGRKVMAGRESEGILRSTFLVDPGGVIRRVWSRVAVKGHVQEVLQALEELNTH